jgi:hypothetical protein
MNKPIDVSADTRKILNSIIFHASPNTSEQWGCRDKITSWSCDGEKSISINSIGQIVDFPDLSTNTVIKELELLAMGESTQSINIVKHMGRSAYVKGSLSIKSFQTSCILAGFTTITIKSWLVPSTSPNLLLRQHPDH